MTAGLPVELAASPIEVCLGEGRIAELGDRARQHGASRVLVVTDPGIVAAGHVERAQVVLAAADIHVTVFDGTRENPNTAVVAEAVHAARAADIDFIVGLGGGSSMDCAKGANLLLTNGGEIADYWGVDKATQPLLPMILVPTTAGTGSEAQSFALISDAVTHRKMACGVRALPTAGGLRPRVAILDPELTASQPRAVAAATGIDAVAHAVESAAATVRTPASRACSRRAWELLKTAYGACVGSSPTTAERSAMLLGAHLGGAAIEQAMLGAAHACANPLTARYGIVHGCAVGLLLPHVVRHNASAGDNPYADLEADVDDLIAHINRLLEVGEIPRRLSDHGIDRAELPALADSAAAEWTAQFNPRPVDAAALLSIYERAFA